jgi:hypothetical protein
MLTRRSRRLRPRRPPLEPHRRHQHRTATHPRLHRPRHLHPLRHCRRRRPQHRLPGGDH